MFFEKYKKLISVLSCVFVVLVFMAISAARGTGSFGENLFNTVFSPVSKAVVYVSDGVGGFFSFVSEMGEYKSENDKLSKEVASLKRDYRSTESYREENERLLSLLELKQNDFSSYETTAARVIGWSSLSWYDELVIDKGSLEGISIKDTVVTEEGLVGQVTDVGLNWARVSTVIDMSSSVGVSVVRTGDIAMIEGDEALSKKGRCRLTYINKDASIVVGDILKTSGLGNLYARGIGVGRVVEIHTDSTGLSQMAEVEPLCNLDSVRVVLVIKNAN